MGFRLGLIAALGFMLTLPPVWADGADAPATRPAHTEDPRLKYCGTHAPAQHLPQSGF